MPYVKTPPNVTEEYDKICHYPFVVLREADEKIDRKGLTSLCNQVAEKMVQCVQQDEIACRLYMTLFEYGNKKKALFEDLRVSGINPKAMRRNISAGKDGGEEAIFWLKNFIRKNGFREPVLVLYIGRDLFLPPEEKRAGERERAMAELTKLCLDNRVILCAFRITEDQKAVGEQFPNAKSTAIFRNSDMGAASFSVEKASAQMIKVFRENRNNTPINEFQHYDY